MEKEKSRLAELQRETDKLKSKLLLAEKEMFLLKGEKESSMKENCVQFDSLRRSLEEKDLLIEEK